MFAVFSNQAENVQISSSSGAFTVTGTSETDITNLSVSITLSGEKYVWIGLISDGSGNDAYMGIYNQQIPNCSIKLYRGVTNIDTFVFRAAGAAAANNTEYYRSPSAYRILEKPSQGTYTYKLTATNSGSTNFAMNYTKLIAMELNF